MFADHLALEIDRAHPKHLDYLARKLWAAHANGTLTDDQAQGLAELLRARQRRPMPSIGGTANSAPAGISRPRPSRSADKQRSIERRRRLARVSPVPPELVDKFTQGELAVIAVVAGEIGRAGACLWCLDKIAAISGVCKTLARTAIAKARALGLLISIQRRRRGQKSLTNVVRALRKSWAKLLVRIASRKTRSSDQEESKSRSDELWGGATNGFAMGGFASAVPKPEPTSRRVGL